MAQLRSGVQYGDLGSVDVVLRVDIKRCFFRIQTDGKKTIAAFPEFGAIKVVDLPFGKLPVSVDPAGIGDQQLAYHPFLFKRGNIHGNQSPLVFDALQILQDLLRIQLSVDQIVNAAAQGGYRQRIILFRRNQNDLTGFFPAFQDLGERLSGQKIGIDQNHIRVIDLRHGKQCGGTVGIAQ